MTAYQEMRARHRRALHRTHRHGNWRQIFYDYNGLCETCGDALGEEFHEVFGENNDSSIIRMQFRALLCLRCHLAEHLYQFPVGRGHPSMLWQDIETELAECSGNMAIWREKYGIKD